MNSVHLGHIEHGGYTIEIEISQYTHPTSISAIYKGRKILSMTPVRWPSRPGEIDFQKIHNTGK